MDFDYYTNHEVAFERIRGILDFPEGISGRRFAQEINRGIGTGVLKNGVGYPENNNGSFSYLTNPEDTHTIACPTITCWAVIAGINGILHGNLESINLELIEPKEYNRTKPPHASVLLNFGAISYHANFYGPSNIRVTMEPRATDFYKRVHLVDYCNSIYTYIIDLKSIEDPQKRRKLCQETTNEYMQDYKLRRVIHYQHRIWEDH